MLFGNLGDFLEASPLAIFLTLCVDIFNNSAHFKSLNKVSVLM